MNLFIKAEIDSQIQNTNKRLLREQQGMIEMEIEFRMSADVTIIYGMNTTTQCIHRII